MYNLPHFKEEDPKEVERFMKAHPFATIIGCWENRPVATQIPLLFEDRRGDLILRGHMMRKQDHQVAMERNPEVLVLFSGPHSYVSATWYSNPNQASTWNYISVHARGRIRFLDQDGLAALLQDLTLHFENHRTDSPTVFANLPEEYRSRLMKSIVAFEIAVVELDHVFKLSQNRERETYHKIISHLQKEGGDAAAIAARMEERSSHLFRD